MSFGLPQEFVGVMLSLGFLLGVVVAVIKVLEFMRPRPPLVEQFVSREHFDAAMAKEAQCYQHIEREIGELKHHVERHFDATEQAMNQRYGVIHSRIDKLVKATSRINGILSAKFPGTLERAQNHDELDDV